MRNRSLSLVWNLVSTSLCYRELCKVFCNSGHLGCISAAENYCYLVLTLSEVPACLISCFFFFSSLPVQAFCQRTEYPFQHQGFLTTMDGKVMDAPQLWGSDQREVPGHTIRSCAMLAMHPRPLPRSGCPVRCVQRNLS